MPENNRRSYDGWAKEFRDRVLNDLAEIKEDHKDTRKKVCKLAEDVSALKVKAGIWGGISGAVSAVISVFIRDKI